MRKIGKAEMLQLYTEGSLFEIATMGDRVIGKTTKGQADNPIGFEVVYCSVQVSTTESLIEKIKGLFK